MNVQLGDGRTPNPQRIARTNNLMPNGGYIPKMENRDDFIHSIKYDVMRY